jgi:hypothetical protein
VTVQACHDWGLSRARRNAELVVSELVSNAVRHAGTPLQLSLSWAAPYLLIGVRDADQAVPRPTEHGDEPEEHGAGLWLVDAVTIAWGYLPTPGGKLVWASLHTTPNRSRRTRSPDSGPAGR